MPRTVSSALRLVDALSRHWYVWVLAYAAITATTLAFFRMPHVTELFYPGSGIALAALLRIPKTAQRHLWFLLSMGLADWLLRLGLTTVAPLMAALLSLTLMFQAYLALSLIQRLSPSAAEPTSVPAVIGFLLWGCLVPVALSAILVAAGSSLANQSPVVFTWLNWFSLRGLSTLLVAPFLIQVCSAAAQSPARQKIRRPLESLVMLVLVAGVTAIVFSTNNPTGQDLASYSFLLIPLLILSAIRLEFAVSAMIVLVMALTAIWFDAGSSAGTREQAQHSLIALSVFLAINQTMVLLLGALVGDRKLALNRVRRLSLMYETLSRVNQTLVQADYDEKTLFETVCGILTGESEFDRACVSVRNTDDSGDFCLTTAVGENSDNLEKASVPAGACTAINQVYNNRKPFFFNDFQNTASCQCAQCLQDTTHWASVAALPIFKNENLYAVLVVFHKRPYIFDDNVIRLMTEMANDLSFALDNLDREQHLKLTAEVFDHSREAIIVGDTDLKILSVNRAFTATTGYTEAEAVGKSVRLLNTGTQGEAFHKNVRETIRHQGYWYGEIWNRRKNGDIFPQRGTILSVKDQSGEPIRFIGVLEDISHHKKAEQQIQQLANFDPLTGLPNRILLQDRFDQAINVSDREDIGLVVLFLDLDDFKHVNDAMGHAYGDELLCAVSHRLQEYLRDTDTLARFGGDEFVLLAHGGESEAVLLADRLIRACNSPYSVAGQSLNISASIGIAMYPSNKNNLNELIQCADAAMYRAKAKGRGTFEFYSPEMQENAQEKLEIKKELHEALRNDDLCLYYQPQVDIVTGEVTGLEALIRWQHPSRGLISPGLFIPLAEESGQIVEVDQWVLATAIKQISVWLEAGIPVVPVAVNISLAQFLRRDLVNELQVLLSLYQVPAELVELELTERIAIADNHYTIETLTTLHKLGVSLSIDDFGTGYSSLSYLRRYPVDTLKIDMSFIRHLDGHPENQGIVRTIISLAKSLDLKVIAEGVENQAQLTFLRQQGCDGYQGYLFSKPLPVSELQVLIKSAV